MTAKSHLRKYIHTNSKGKEVIHNNLYRDEMTNIFYVRIYHNGAVRSRSLKTDNYLVAKSKITETIKAISGEVKKTQNKLMSEYYEDFVKIHESKGTAPQTLIRYKSIWKNNLSHFWSSYTAEDIDQQAVAAYVKWQKKFKGTLLFSDFKVLKQLFRLMKFSGEKLKEIDMSLPRAEKIHNEIQKGTYVTKEEIALILDNTASDRYRFIFELSYTTGMRKGEIISLRKSYLKTIKGHLFIELPSETTKTRKSRIIPLTKSLAKEISNIADRSKDYLFPQTRFNREMHIPGQIVDRAWTIAKNRAGIKRRIRFHDLRHTCATNLANSGTDPIKASTFLGMSVRIWQKVYVKKNELDLTSLLKGTELK